MRVLKLIQDATIRERGENMLNYWWVTRPKRKLNSVPSIGGICRYVTQSRVGRTKRFSPCI